MRTFDQNSVYSASTLVGGGEDEARDEFDARRALILQARRRGDNTLNEDDIDEDEYLHQQPDLDLTQIGDDVVGGITLSRQGSLSTLHNNPSSSRSIHHPYNRRNFDSQAGTSRFQSAPTPRSRIESVAEDPEIEESDLQVPWWSPILPNPVLGRRKSSGKLRVSSSPNAPDRSPLSNSSAPSSSSHSTSLHPRVAAHQRRPSPAPPILMSSGNGTGNVSLGRSAQEHSPSRHAMSGPPSPYFYATPIPPPMPLNWPLYTKCYCEENAYLLAAYLSRVCDSYNKQEMTKIPETRTRWEVDVVVVSNKNQTVMMWEQEAAKPGRQVIWDYHVFVIVSCQQKDSMADANKGKETGTGSGQANTPRLSRSFLFSSKRAADASSNEGEDTTPTMSWVYDLDSRLSAPTPLTDYISATFGLEKDRNLTLPKRYRPSFRVISVKNYLTRFGSDRSHMARPISTNDSSQETFEWIAPRPEWDLIFGCKAVYSNSYFMETFVDMRVKVGDGRFGTIVKLEDLMSGVGLMTERTDWEPENIAAGVAVLLDRVQLNEQQGEDGEEEAVTTPVALNPINVSHDEEEIASPGFMIGGIQRYGMRPPPPPPDGAIIPSNRGKRIMDPLYPAYILSAFEHRAAKNRSSMIQSPEAKVSA